MGIFTVTTRQAEAIGWFSCSIRHTSGVGTDGVRCEGMGRAEAVRKAVALYRQRRNLGREYARGLRDGKAFEVRDTHCRNGLQCVVDYGSCICICDGCRPR